MESTSGTMALVNADVRDPPATTKAVTDVDVVVDNAALVPVRRSNAATYRSLNVDGCSTTIETARDADLTKAKAALAGSRAARMPRHSSAPTTGTSSVRGRPAPAHTGDPSRAAWRR